MSSTFKTSIIRDDTDLAIAVEFEYSKGERGHRDRYGAQEEPDVDPSIEILNVEDATGNLLKLTPEEDALLESRCWDEVAADHDDL